MSLFFFAVSPVIQGVLFALALGEQKGERREEGWHSISNVKRETTEHSATHCTGR